MAKRKTRKAGQPGGLTDKGGEAVDKAINKAGGNSRDVAGPSPNPATNLIVHDIALRAGGRLLRHTLEKGLLRNRYGGKGAKAMVENRSLVQVLASYAVARAATSSIPGALLVGGGLLAKTLFDRGKGRRQARREGDRTMREMAED